MHCHNLGEVLGPFTIVEMLTTQTHFIFPKTVTPCPNLEKILLQLFFLVVIKFRDTVLWVQGSPSPSHFLLLFPPHSCSLHYPLYYCSNAVPQPELPPASLYHHPRGLSTTLENSGGSDPTPWCFKVPKPPSQLQETSTHSSHVGSFSFGNFSIAGTALHDLLSLRFPNTVYLQQVHKNVRIKKK